MKKILDPAQWDHPIMFLIFLGLAIVPTIFVLHKAFAAVGLTGAAQVTGVPFGIAC